MLYTQYNSAQTRFVRVRLRTCNASGPDSRNMMCRPMPGLCWCTMGLHDVANLEPTCTPLFVSRQCDGACCFVLFVLHGLLRMLRTTHLMYGNASALCACATPRRTTGKQVQGSIASQHLCARVSVCSRALVHLSLSSPFERASPCGSRPGRRWRHGAATGHGHWRRSQHG